MTIQQTIKLVREDYWNLWYYWQGTIRQWLFNNYSMFIRLHIMDQYFWRMGNSSDCSKNGSCVVCGCKTDDLFFANKPCALSHIHKEHWYIFNKKKVCYPKMMSKKEWIKFKQENNIQ
jgi:hypothetical protein